MIRLLLRLNSVRWKRAAAVAALAVIPLQQLHIRRQAAALRARPRVERQVKYVRVEGPVRIVTRTVKTEGREEIVREELHAAVTEAREDVRISEPVFAPAARAGGWLAGASGQPFHRWERDGWTAWGGYSFGGRLNVCAGVTGAGRAAALALWRF